jgi:hypothetical protein
MTPLAACYAAGASSNLLDRQWVAMGPTGKLEYKTTAKGDRIMDFSHAGYMGGGVAIPTVPVKKEVAPSGKDDSAAIQEAINAVGAMPLDGGFRGAVLLKPGIFQCAKQITIENDGVVLRGSGSGKDGTVLEMTGEPHTAVVIYGPDSKGLKHAPEGTPITDVYVPAGALSFSVKSTAGLKAGDHINIFFERTGTWIKFMNMDNIVRKRVGQEDSPRKWMKEDRGAGWSRTIRSISGNRITLDVPITDYINAELLENEPAMVIKTPTSIGRSQCGIESLQINSTPHKGNLRAGKNVAIAINRSCQDCWIKDIVMNETINDIHCNAGSKRITITKCRAQHSSTVEDGAGAASDIALRGSQILVDRCSSKHDAGGFFITEMNPAAQLNVVLNCTYDGQGSIQPHMKWSTGLLIDSCKFLNGGRIDLINRYAMGSGHGWAIGWGVAWNCQIGKFQFQQPPGSFNIAIGCSGEPHKTSDPGALYSHGQPVTPASLYLAQLRERLGDAAVKNIGY